MTPGGGGGFENRQNTEVTLPRGPRNSDSIRELGEKIKFTWAMTLELKLHKETPYLVAGEDMLRMDHFTNDTEGREGLIVN